MTIHPTAIIEDGAQLGADVSIGPYSIIGRDVVLGDNVIIESHVVVTGKTSIGSRTHIFPFVCLLRPAINAPFSIQTTLSKLLLPFLLKIVSRRISILLFQLFN